MDQLDVADLRAIVLDKATGGKDREKISKLAEFTKTEDSAATCAAADTAGWGGMELCIEACSSDKRYNHRIATREGACVVLCTLAVHPCTEK